MSVAVRLTSTALLIAVTPAWGAEAADPPYTSDEIVVTGSIYRGDVATGGARIDAEVRDLPLSISVVTEALIKDRQVRNLRELSENVAGVRSRASGSGAFTVDFTIRGLQGGNGSVVAMNGFRMENFSAGFDPQAAERVEFLKGPASVLYGASGALSGLVNIVTKTARSDDFLIVDATGGLPGYGRATFDGNIRLTDTLDARTNVAVTREDVQNAFRDIDEQFIHQSLRWHPTPTFSLLGEASYFNAVQPSREATTYPSLTQFLDVPKRLKLGEAWDRNANRGYNLRLDGSWEIAPHLTLRQGVNYQSYRETDFDSAFYANEGDQFLAPGVIARSARRGLGKTNYFVSQTEVRGSFGLGPMTHKLLVGFEYGRENFGGLCCDGVAIAPLDLANPVYGAPKPSVDLVSYFGNTIRSKAFYVQDFVSWGQFRLLAGLRRDDTRSTSGYCDTRDAGCPDNDIVANRGRASKQALSPRLGLTWQPGDHTTLFVSWSKSFNPNTALDRNNRLLEPERGIQYEAGIRQDLLEPGRLTVSASLFDLTRRNIGDCDPTFSDCSRSIAIGEQRIKGAEVEVSGKPVDWLDLLATYAYLDGKVTRSDFAISGIPVGSKLPEAAKNSGSLFAKAALTPLGLAPVSVSAGVYYVSSRPGRDYFSNFFAGPFADPLRRLPGSTRVDLGTYWDVSERVRLQANITNVFDVFVYEPVNLGFARSLPRRATVGVRLSL